MSFVLSKHLPLLATAPDGIQKLRGLILELAMRGKLVPQDPNDEPATELLERIAQEWAQLGVENKGKKSKAVPVVGEEARPFEVPESWRWIRLAQLNPEFQNGESSRGAASGHEMVVLRLADISDGKISLSNTRSIILPEISIEKYQLQKNDLLVIRVNGSAEIVGRLILCDTSLTAIYCDHFIRVRVRDTVIAPRFLRLIGDAPVTRRQIQSLFITTAGQKTVNQGHMGGLIIPFPPLAEQHRIVAKVDELMALCDRLETEQADAESAHVRLIDTLLGTLTQSTDAADLAGSWQRLAAHFDTIFTTERSLTALKQTILQLAVTGNLAPRDPEEVPVRGKLGDFVEFLNGYAFKSEWFTESGVRLLRNANVSHGCCDWIDTAYVTRDRLEEFKRFELAAGDLVLSLDRPIINTGLKIARVSQQDLPCLLLQRVAKISPRSDLVDLDYLSIWFNSPAFIQTITPGRSNGVPHISTKQVSELPFVRYSITEQRIIVTKVNQLMKLLDRLKADITESCDRQTRLASTLIETALEAA